MKRNKKGFTLVELLVVVLIIGVLAAISLPMYQKAVKRSRFSALMPIAKALNEGNEHYYLNHSAYSTDPAELDIAGKDEYDDDTEVYLVDEDGFAYVMAYNEDRLPDNKYIAFQKHSDQFANTTMCEAADDAAGQICESFGGTPLEGGITSGWTAYLLTGDATGSKFCPAGATCNSQGEVMECPSGKTLKEGKCVACDIANAASCSTTSYAATSCVSGYCMKNGACVTCNFSGNMECRSTAYDIRCTNKTYTDSAACGGNDCTNSSFSGESYCGIYGQTYNRCNGSTFTDNARCTNGAHCHNATFSGNSSCDGSSCGGTDGGITTFTDNATCVGSAACDNALFSGNSICTSTYAADAGCGFSYAVGGTTFTENSVCAGNGCRYVNYEDNACCAGSSCPSGVLKCVYNSTTKTYDRVGYWD